VNSDVIAIPRSGRPEHVQENRDVLDLRLTEDDLARLNRAFLPPTEPRPLEMIQRIDLKKGQLP